MVERGVERLGGGVLKVGDGEVMYRVEDLEAWRPVEARYREFDLASEPVRGIENRPKGLRFDTNLLSARDRRLLRRRSTINNRDLEFRSHEIVATFVAFFQS